MVKMLVLEWQKCGFEVYSRHKLALCLQHLYDTGAMTRIMLSTVQVYCSKLPCWEFVCLDIYGSNYEADKWCELHSPAFVKCRKHRFG